MCRLLYVRSQEPFEISSHLQPFASIAENSKEYQGHGWGCAWLEDGEWKIYKNITPIWQDDLNQFGKTTVLLVHARSAFRDKDIHIVNNMPFIKNDFVFIFNGELHGVKIKEEGRIGAEKIFNFILRFYKKDLLLALKKGAQIITNRSEYIRAMNIIIADKEHAFLSTQFNENRDYFTMYKKESPNKLIICSQPYPGNSDWEQIPNQTIRKY